MEGKMALYIIKCHISNTFMENGSEEDLDQLHDAFYVLENYVKCVETAVKEIEMEAGETNLVNDIASKIITGEDSKHNDEIITAVKSGMKMAVTIFKKYKKLNGID